MTRLVDLHPRWVERDGQRVAFVFKCPCCAANPQKSNWWLSCTVVGLTAGEQDALFRDAMKDAGQIVVGCNQNHAWKIAGGSDFGDLSITPSIDASASGHWHGFITGGEAKP